MQYYDKNLDKMDDNQYKIINQTDELGAWMGPGAAVACTTFCSSGCIAGCTIGCAAGAGVSSAAAIGAVAFSSFTEVAVLGALTMSAE